jgi:CRISPR/Cas system-associated exonuclease Cas4 (RecB family)
MVMIEKIEEFYGKDKQRNDGFIHISSSGKCQRQLYYDLILDKENPIEPRIKRVFDNGNGFHQRMMKVIYQIPGVRVIGGEIAIPENESIKGTCDCIVGIGDLNYVVDFKSINASSFSYLSEPKQEHVTQLALYMYYFGVQQGLLIYENKDSQELKEYVIKYKEVSELMAETFEKLNLVRDSVKTRVLPPKPTFTDKEKWKCEYCNYKSECAQDYNMMYGNEKKSI